MVGIDANPEDGFKQSHIVVVCNHYARLASTNRSLETRYLHLVEESDRLKTLSDRLRTEFVYLINQSTSITVDNIKETASHIGRQKSIATFNQVVTGMEEIQSSRALEEIVDDLERTGIGFFMFLKESSQRMINVIRGMEERAGRPIELKLSSFEELISGQEANPVKKSPIGESSFFLSLKLVGESKERTPHSPVSAFHKASSQSMPSGKVSEIVLSRIRRYQLLQLFLSPPDIQQFSLKYRHSDIALMRNFSELIETAHESLRAKVQQIITAFLHFLYDVKTDEDRVAESLRSTNPDEVTKGKSESSLPSDISVSEDMAETVNAIFSGKRKAASPRKGRFSGASEGPATHSNARTSRKSESPSSPRRCTTKARFLPIFSAREVNEEEEEVSLLKMAREAIKMKNRTSVDSSRSLPKVSTSTSAISLKTKQDTTFEQIRKLRTGIAKVRLLGKR